MTRMHTTTPAGTRRRGRHRLPSARWAGSAHPYPRSRPLPAGARASHAGSPDDERGDVPGWVLVTLMTAGLVLALWAVAGPALTGVFSDSIARVSGAVGG